MLMRRFDDARRRGDREVTVWGTGTPRRELMHVDDLASACLFLMERSDQNGFVNVGTGKDHTIRVIASLVRDLIHPCATLVFDTTMPDGTPRKVLDVSKLNRMGWTADIDLADGLRSMVDWYRTADRIRGLDLTADPDADAA
jgi:GDP-L-fucose synthase